MILLFFAGLALLWIGGEGLVRASAALGIRLGMTPVVVGLTIVAFATSAPELAVSLGAAFRDSPGLAVGNVVGSNICNITLVLGVAALIKRPRLKGQLVPRDTIVLILSTLLVPALLLDGLLGRIEGLVLVGMIVSYVALTVRQAKSGQHRMPSVDQTAPATKPAGATPPRALIGERLPQWLQKLLRAAGPIPLYAFSAAVSVGVLIVGSDLFVQAAVGIAMVLGISSALVGLSAAALGTSLPELATSVVAARRGQPELAAGNLIGSNIFNLLLILGATSLVRPLAPNGVGLVDLGVMIATSLIALALMLFKPRIDRPEGALLIIAYAAYMGWLFGSLG